MRGERGVAPGARLVAPRRPPLRKALGQHHLRRPELARPLVRFLEPAGRRVVEIGPGGGALTRLLLEAGARVDAFELDLRWACHLRRTLPDRALRLVVADATGIPWGSARAPLLVGGNLPYAVGTVIVERILRAVEQVERAAFLLQHEVAVRLVAQPGDRAYGALSAMVAMRCEARLLGIVRPGSFDPPPRVVSAFVGLQARPRIDALAFEPFVRITRAAFTQPRKTLHNSLGTAVGRERALGWLARAGLDPKQRPQNVRPEELLELTRAATAGPDRC